MYKNRWHALVAVAALIAAAPASAYYTYRLPVPGIAQGTDPVLQLSSNTVSFPGAIVGKPTSQSVQITNGGQKALQFKGLPALSGPNAGEFVVSGCAADVPGGASCSLTIGFTPNAIGAHNASVAVASNGGSGVIALTAPAVQPPPSDTGDGVSTAGACSNGAASNCATFNPNDASKYITVSNGNLSAANTPPGYFSSVRATISKSSGKWYWETTYTSTAIGGIGTSAAAIGTGNYPGNDVYGWGLAKDNGTYAHGGTNISIGASDTSSSVTRYALNMDAGTLSVYSGSRLIYTMVGIKGQVFPMFALSQPELAMTANFGQRTFAFPPPSGYHAGLF